MKNVIVFAVEDGRFAVELRWVREVITMGHATFVPGAPRHLVGAINVRGAITPVLDLTVLARHAEREGDRSGMVPASSAALATGRGDGALLLDVDGTDLALRMVKVDEVVTASLCPERPEDTCAGVADTAVLDSAGRVVRLVDPHALVQLTLAQAQELAADHPAGTRAGAAGEYGGPA